MITKARASSRASSSARAASVARRKRPQRSISKDRSSPPAGVKSSAVWTGDGGSWPTMREYGAPPAADSSGNLNERAIVTCARASRMRAAAMRTS